MFNVFGGSRCKLHYNVPILAPRALMLNPWAPRAVLQRIVQGFWGVPGANLTNLTIQGANPKALGVNGGFTKAR